MKEAERLEKIEYRKERREYILAKEENVRAECRGWNSDSDLDWGKESADEMWGASSNLEVESEPEPESESESESEEEGEVVLSESENSEAMQILINKRN